MGALAAAVLLTGCGRGVSTEGLTDAANDSSVTAAQESVTGAAEQTAAESVSRSASDMFTDRDYEVGYDETTATVVTLNGTTATASGDGVTVDGNTVTLTQEGTYVLTGTLTGSVVIDMDSAAKPHIILRNASVTSADGAALRVEQADKVFVTLAEGTDNTLSNGGSFSGEEEGVDGAVFSRDDITFNGTGSLTVASPAGHGIVGKDDVVFTGGAYQISAASHGVDANDSVRAANASFTILSGKDGVHCENSDDTTKGFVYLDSGSLVIEAEGDGISASADVTVETASLSVTAGGGSANAEKKTSDGWGAFKGGDMGGHMGGGMGGGQGRPDMGGEMPGQPGAEGTVGLAYEADQTVSAEQLAATSDTSDSDSTSIKGIKADGDITVNGGDVTVDAADDAIHAGGSVTVNGGTLTLATGDDGVHADGDLTVTDGNLTVTESYEGLEGLTINLSGGQISVNADDDGLNAAGGSDQSGFGGMRGGDRFGGGFGATDGAAINISGGQVSVKAGGDGIDSNGTIDISGGAILVDCPTVGDTSPFDYESTASITGGTLIATGSANMAEGFTSSSQGVITARVSEQGGNTTLTVTDASGAEILSTTPENAYNYVLVSAPELTSGQSYTLTVGNDSGSVTAK